MAKRKPKLKWRCQVKCKRHCVAENDDILGDKDNEFPTTCLYGHGDADFELIAPRYR